MLKRWRAGRFNVAGRHLAITLNWWIAGIAIWPPGPWPKEPVVYRFYEWRKARRLIRTC